MNKQLFKLNGAGIIDIARLQYVIGGFSSITDSRFAVINGLLFDMLAIEGSTGFSCSISAYAATDCYSAEHTSALIAAYTPASFIVGFEFFVSEELCEQDNQLCIDAEENAERLFVHLIEQALFNSNATTMHLRNFARGLDLDCIQGVA